MITTNIKIEMLRLPDLFFLINSIKQLANREYPQSSKLFFQGHQAVSSKIALAN